MTLKQAVKKLGGPTKAATKSGLPRTSIIYWMGLKPDKLPHWRADDIEKIIQLARGCDVSA